ncbi:hypothetical protein HYALB_00003228 [Hymenoscyphus albidus]|uniref:SET domain-containing protein n=1 Tax=Hymenoscyphus albidus TaxID=595503 RepID=A0A9N9M0U7_9HELO|nr:hypothetical protein HYALB_00003228 [Hymenoscyphus albidus]
MPKQLRIDELLEWGRSHHTILHPSVEVYRDDVTGLSFRAKEDVPPGAKLVSCAYQTTLSFLNAIPYSFLFESHGSKPFPLEFISQLALEDPHIIGHFFLMQQYLMGKRSFWWKYIRLLPQPDQPDLLAIPIWWPEADRRFLWGTNAEPPVEIRRKLWMIERAKGIKLLESSPEHQDWDEYTQKLYFWAATIFGTRSFRASLTVPEEGLVEQYKGNHKAIWECVTQDRFSVLLPILDIGNHDGVNRVEWSKHPDTGHFALSTCKAVEKGEQIFNYYGDKSNSELLVGYGFTLDSPSQDVVNLKLVPSAEAIRLRRSQSCHNHRPTSHPEEEFMFGVRTGSLVERAKGSLGLESLPHGLLEALICMVANNRERRFIEQNPQYCLQVDLDFDSFAGPLYRAFFSAIRILYIKIRLEMERLHDTGEGLGSPSNHNQTMALKYRTQQNSVLMKASSRLSQILEDALLFKSFDAQVPETFQNDQNFPAGLLTLMHAFSWLQAQYSGVHDSVVSIISEDQEEDLPLDWRLLIVDWDNTYWCVWIYTIWLLWARDGQAFQERHPAFRTWLDEMRMAYSKDQQDGAYDILHASPSEVETINLTVEAITNLPQFKSARDILMSHEKGWEPLRNFASFVAKEETVAVTSGGLEQRVLAINKTRGP